MAYSDIWGGRIDFEMKGKKRVQAAEMWFHRRLLNVTYKDRRTNVSILEELDTDRELRPGSKKKIDLVWTFE